MKSPLILSLTPAFGLGLLFLAAGGGIGRAAPASQVEIRRDVEIGKGGTKIIHADLAWPAAPGKAPMPGIVFVHGGGWWKGSNHINGPLSWPGSLAAAGYFIVSVDYRLSGDAPWPAQIEDCKLAVRWLRANAAKYGVDPERIGCWGSSAGGHLVVCMGTMRDARFEGDGGYPGVSSAVQAVADFNGPTDMTTGSAGITGVTKGDAKIIVKLFGGTFEEKPEAWKDGSPILYVRQGDPPFLIVHGDADRTVPFQQSTELVAALQKAGVPVELVEVKGGGHSLRAPAGKPAAVPDERTLLADVRAFFDRTLKP